MSWTCSAATRPGHLAVIELTMNFSEYQSILESKLGHATRQRSQAHRQVYSKMAETEKNQGVAMTQLKVRPQTD